MGRMNAGVMALLVGCASAHEPDAPGMEPEAGTLTGRVSWELEFADGDRCTYSRSYQAVEDRSAPWLCPECTVMWRATVELEGEDCYARISSIISDEEWLGWDGETWYRSTRAHARLTPQGVAWRQGDAIDVAHVTDRQELDGSTTDVRITGAFEAEVIAADPMHGWRSPHISFCGWSKTSVPPYQGDWRLEVDGRLPDGWFLDRCNQPVRLHELVREYLVVVVSAGDCPPCQVLARGEALFVEGMRHEGIDVEVVTLLAPSLSATLEPSPPSLLAAWADIFGVHGPVLSDRGWGRALGLPVLGEAYGYPMIVTVGPDLRVMDVRTGYGGFESIAAPIRAHAKR